LFAKAGIIYPQLLRKDWHYFKETADQMKLLICFLAARPCKHRIMNKDEVLAEIFADQDSDAVILVTVNLSPVFLMSLKRRKKNTRRTRPLTVVGEGLIP